MHSSFVKIGNVIDVIYADCDRRWYPMLINDNTELYPDANQRL